MKSLRDEIPLCGERRGLRFVCGMLPVLCAKGNRYGGQDFIPINGIYYIDMLFMREESRYVFEYEAGPF